MPGLTYRMVVEHDPMRTIHILRYSPKAGVATLTPALASKTVYEAAPAGAPDTKGRNTTSQIARQYDAIAAVNADYFPFTGDPSGLMVRDGTLISLPNTKRSAFAWGPNGAMVNRSAFFATVSRAGEGPSGARLFSIDALNEECPLNRIALNLPVAGRVLAKAPNAMALIKLDSDRLPPSTEMGASVVAVVPDQDSLQIPAGQAVLVGQGDRAPLIRSLQPGQKLTIRMETSGFGWERYDSAVGGGPRLLRNGDVDVPLREEGFAASHGDVRHPRTAIGVTRTGDLVLMVVDGRQAQSVGATLVETAEIMRREGCVEALNLDGGGSSAMSLLGLTMNKPSDPGGERAVANALVFRANRPATTDEKLRLRLPARIVAGRSARAEILNAANTPVPNAEILWSLAGPAWIDGGGTIHGLSGGTATLQAYVRGKTLTGRIQVTGKVAAPIGPDPSDAPAKRPVASGADPA